MQSHFISPKYHKSGDFTFKIDLKDTYFHFPIPPDSCKQGLSLCLHEQGVSVQGTFIRSQHSCPDVHVPRLYLLYNDSHVTPPSNLLKGNHTIYFSLSFYNVNQKAVIPRSSIMKLEGLHFLPGLI